jgi:hypothetical protein
VKKRANLLSIGNDAKTVKGERVGYLTGILYLAPSDISGWNLCPTASAGCAMACLYSAGRGAFTSVQRARIQKTREFMHERSVFRAQLVRDVAKLVRKATREGMSPTVRLNGTSDLKWESIAPELFATFPDVQFYDYTADEVRYRKWLEKITPRSRRDFTPNYHLTFSRKEHHSDGLISSLLGAGATVTVPYVGATFAEASKVLRARFRAPRVVNGDTTDLRFLDRRGSLVLLTAKGRLGKSDTSGFVIRLGGAK